MSECSELLIATGNRGKVKEIQKVLSNLPVKLYDLREFPEILAPEESGASYEDNAIIKGRWYAKQTGLWALADDSGLEVAALAGAPGIRSARLGETAPPMPTGLNCSSQNLSMSQPLNAGPRLFAL